MATVDGEAIEKEQFTHWMNVAAKSTGQANAAVPDPEAEYKNCIATKRKATPSPAKGQPKVTDDQLKTQCKQEYEQLRNQVLQLLISFQWIQGEASAMDVKVTDAEVKKSFAEQKKQSFPKEEDYKKFIKTSGQTEADILQRVKLDLLSNKIRDKVVKGKDTVSDKAIQDFYNKNKARFAQPEKRDLRVVLTKDKAKADEAKAALEGGDSWTKVAKKYSIDDTSKASGGKLPAQAKGTLDKEASTTPSSPPPRTSSSVRSRPSTATTSSRSPTSRRRRSRRSPRPRRPSSRPSSPRTSRRLWTSS